MTDTHTHILPGIDDGAKDVEMSLAMLRMERDQGVDTVVLTPHFYRKRERLEDFLARRRQAAQVLTDGLNGLPEEERLSLPRLLLGAEVAWIPNLHSLDGLEQLCIGESRCILVELPFAPWGRDLVDQLYSFGGRTGFTMILAHIERYLKIQKPDVLADVLALGVPVQVSAEYLLHPLRRGPVLRLLRDQQAQLLISDCHNLTSRPPNLGPGMEVLARKLGKGGADALARASDAVLS